MIEINVLGHVGRDVVNTFCSYKLLSVEQTDATVYNKTSEIPSLMVFTPGSCDLPLVFTVYLREYVAQSTRRRIEHVHHSLVSSRTFKTTVLGPNLATAMYLCTIYGCVDARVAKLNTCN